MKNKNYKLKIAKRLLVLTAIYLLPSAFCFAQGTPGTVRCPGNVDTLDSLFRLTDSARTNLSGAIAANATSIPVLSTSLFPSSGSLKIDAEVIYYSSKTTTTFENLVRGASGTTAASHTINALAQSTILAAHHNTLVQAIICAQEKALAAQVADPDLAAIAGLTPANDDFMQRKAGAWTNRTPAQVKTDLAVDNVNNTSDANKPVSTAQQTALNAKVAANLAITGATKTKVTYDAKGLVTAGADATTADVADSADKRYVTDAQRTVIQNTSGTNTGDQDLSGKQDADADLTVIAGLSPANDDVLQRKAGSWINRTIAQLKVDLAVNNVDNTSDANKPVSTATQTALDAKLTSTPTANQIIAPLACLDAGSTDAYVCPTSPAASSLTNLTLIFKPNTSNTGAASVNPSSLGVTSIKKLVGGSVSDPADGDLRAGGRYLLTFDGTQFLIVSLLGNGAAGIGSINGDAAATQTFVAGNGISVTDSGGGAHTIANSGEFCLNPSGTSIDLNSASPQDVYTVPAGKTLVFTKAIFSGPSVNLTDGDSSSLRIYESETGLLVATAVLASSTSLRAALIARQATGAGALSISAGNKVQARPDVAYGAAATITVRVFGILF